MLFLTAVWALLNPFNINAEAASKPCKKNISSKTKAQSYLAPPACYDLNRWHGIKIIKAVNGRIAKPAFPFKYQDMTHQKVRDFGRRIGIGQMMESSKNELELVQKICDWANSRWGHMQPMPYPAWDGREILDKVEKGDAFWCTFKAALFVHACNAAGLNARMLGINIKDSYAHTVTEVYNNDYRKWVLVDPWMNCYYQRNGIPLSALQFHQSVNDSNGINVIYGSNGRFLEYWDYKTGKAENIPSANRKIPLKKDKEKGLLEYYHDIRIVLRNDRMVNPQPKENTCVDGFMVPYNPRGGDWWGPQLHWVDENTSPLITCDNTSRIEDFQWPLNEVKVDLKKISLPGAPAVLQVSFSTLTPNFSHYRLEVDGKTVNFNKNTFLWKLKKGRNSLTVTSINDSKRPGFPSEFVLEYAPSLTDFSRKVTVELKNPGFENSTEDQRPAKWHTITSNPLKYGCFELDSAVKHSGSFSLKASPARDLQTGIEYAFIVKSATFNANASTDVIYSIWLKASRENTPVDLALMDASPKNSASYVKRISVGKKWKKYELKCRLHNEIQIIYVGFKVYNNTIWADDANIIEAGH